MNVNIEFIEIGAQAELFCIRARVRQCRLRGFLHHIAELPREQQAAFAGHERDFDCHRVAARAGDGETGRHADLVLFFFHAVHEFRGTEIFVERFSGNGCGRGFAFGDMARNFAAHLRDFAFEIAHACFVRIIANQAAQCFVRKFWFVNQPVLFLLARDDELFCNRKFFFFDVAGKFNHFHAVEQRGRNRVEQIRGRNENDFAQIVRHFEIMVAERVVLFRVQNFEQCRARVAAKIRADFVNLVEHENGIDGFRALHCLDNAPGHCADVCAAMPADFRFIANAAERHAHKTASQCLRDAAPHRSFTRAGRTDETQNGRRHFICREFAHGDIFQNAFFGAFQPVMLLVQ